MLDIKVDLEKLNEADVRGEIIDPLLRALGYRAGSENHISREPTLRYEFFFLGRKKNSDVKIEGRPDYILEISDVGRWILEVKSPSKILDVDDFEQAQSYSLHPNVAAAIFVLTNGREFRIYAQSARGFEDFLVRIEYEQIEAAWESIYGFLSPEGFARRVPRPHFDLRLPVAHGFGPVLRLVAGLASPEEARVSIPLPEDAMRSLANMQSHMPKATCERREDGQLNLFVEFSSTVGVVQQIIAAKGLSRVQLHTQSQFLSVDRAFPTLFTSEFPYNVKAGDEQFSMTQWQLSRAPFDIDGRARIDALAYVDGERVEGRYSLRMFLHVPALGWNAEAEQVGTFQFDIVSHR